MIILMVVAVLLQIITIVLIFCLIRILNNLLADNARNAVTFKAPTIDDEEWYDDADYWKRGSPLEE